MDKVRKVKVSMQVVICDDNVENLKDLETLLLQYGARYPDVSFDMETYSDASVLLQKIQLEKPADLYILDIVMSRITGIDLGYEIRKKSEESIIIYITASDGFALDAYNIFAIRYLLKPVEENRFFEAMDYALSQMENKKEPLFLVKTKAGLESIPYREIAYIESCSRKLEIHLAGGGKKTSIYIRNSFDEEIKELIRAGNFLSVHKSFLINLSYVRKLTPNNVTMINGDSIPISRKSSFQVKKEYLSFISEQYK